MAALHGDGSLNGKLSSDEIIAGNLSGDSGTISGAISSDARINGKTSSGEAGVKGSLSTDGGMNGSISSSGNDYNTILHKPMINGVVVQGSKIGSDYNLASVYSHTTAEWNTMRDLASVKDAIYIYTDYMETEDGTVAGIKIGDGTTYVVDLPFVDTLYRKHIEDTVSHITQEEREFWNSKNRAVAYGETLMLTDL